MKKGKSLLTFDKTDLQESLSEAKDSLSDAESESAKSIEKAQKQLAEAQEEPTPISPLSRAKPLRRLRKSAFPQFVSLRSSTPALK